MKYRPTSLIRERSLVPDGPRSLLLSPKVHRIGHLRPRSLVCETIAAPLSLARIAFTLLTLGAVNCTSAETALDYQGKITVANQAFSGQGHFVFVLLGNNTEVLWSSGELPASHSLVLPRGAVNLQVTNGLYSVRLGDTAQAMPPLDASIRG